MSKIVGKINKKLIKFQKMKLKNEEKNRKEK